MKLIYHYFVGLVPSGSIWNLIIAPCLAALVCKVCKLLSPVSDSKMINPVSRILLVHAVGAEQLSIEFFSSKLFVLEKDGRLNVSSSLSLSLVALRLFALLLLLLFVDVDGSFEFVECFLFLLLNCNGGCALLPEIRRNEIISI